MLYHSVQVGRSVSVGGVVGQGRVLDLGLVLRGVGQRGAVLCVSHRLSGIRISWVRIPRIGIGQWGSSISGDRSCRIGKGGRDQAHENELKCEKGQ